MIFKFKAYLLAISSVLVIASCGGNKQDELEEVSSDSGNAAVLDSQKISAQNVFNAVPDRKQILSLLQLSQAEYNPTILNNPDDVNKYSLEGSKALNLGVYGSDLNTASVFEQNQESIMFFKCVSTLAKNLGISNCFDEKMGDRMEANKENRDSTLEIISQSFKNADSFLKANGRPGTSSLIVAGAWIEGFYIACSIAKETKNEPMVKEILGQTESLKPLIELLAVSKLGNESAYLLEDLKVLLTILEAKSGKGYSVAALTDADKKITELRNKVISSK